MKDSTLNCPENISAKEFADFSLDIGTFLLASGAHCGRLNSNIGRMSQYWGLEIQMLPTFRGLLVTVTDNNHETITMYKNSPTHSVHLDALTDISHLSWNVLNNGLSFQDTKNIFNSIKNKKRYGVLLVSIAVGFACAGLCLLAGGDYINGAITWCGAFIGSLVRFWISSKKFNPMISISIAAFITTLITGLGSVLNLGSNPETAMATAVLYLIPGVPLVNCVIDLIEGYLSSSMNRALFAGFILLCIAAGMTLCITLLGINNFAI